MNNKRNSKTKATFLTTLLLIITLFLNVQPSQAQCHLDDWTALKALYESTDGDNWRDNTGWEQVAYNVSQPKCNLEELYGITLNENGRVIELDLWFNTLSGEIPKNLSKLIYLEVLSLKSNLLTGHIPPEIGNLNMLRELYLNSNDIRGNIPAEIGNISSLTILDITFNELSGNIPLELGNLINLTHLLLGGNKLSGKIPSELGNLGNLTSLLLQNNELNSSIPTELANLNNLIQLNLSYNQLTGIYPSEISKWCGQFSSDQIDQSNNFEISWNTFCTWGDFAIICNFDDWNALKALYENTDGDNWTNRSGWETIIDDKNEPPTNCNLRELYGVELDSFRVLTLDLANNNLSGNIPVELVNLDSLTNLFLSNNELSGSIPAELASLNNLTNLTLRYNQLSGSYPIEIFGWCDKFSSYDIYSGNNFEVNWNTFCKWGVNSIVCDRDDWDALKTLYESTDGDNWRYRRGWETMIDNKSEPPANCNLRELYGVELDLRRVITLDLPDNNLNGKIPTSIVNLNKLKYLSLKNNYCKGTLPKSLGSRLSNLTHLDVSNNKLSGTLHKSLLGNLNRIIYLNLSNNQFSGGLPVELENISKKGCYLTEDGGVTCKNGDGCHDDFTQILLNNNQFNGIVPKFKSVCKLNISNNNFSCSDIQKNFHHNTKARNFDYSPQKFNMVNYEEIYRNIYDTVGNSLTFDVELPWNDFGNLNFQWKRNGVLIDGANDLAFYIGNIQPSTVGKYTLEVNHQKCIQSNHNLEFVSEPIYVLLKGYDFLGQPIEYTQLMVEYEDTLARNRYEKEIFLDNGGNQVDKCNCNRELYLYDFPDDEGSIEEAYIALDQKIKSVKMPNTGIDGGINYQLNNVGLNFLSVQTPANIQTNNIAPENDPKQAYTAHMDYPEGDYNDEVNIYKLDSGLDLTNLLTDQLLDAAPVDNCYNISASGYNYTLQFIDANEVAVPIDTNYQDLVGHGTFGFNTISDGLQDIPNTTITPLKIIEEASEGKLFDLVCALYHAIDHDADVINISAGFRGEASGILETALYQAKEKGIFIVAAAGNDGLDMDLNPEKDVPQYPAYYASQSYKFYANTIDTIIRENDTIYPTITKLDSVAYNNLISVGAVNVHGELNENSNYGALSVTLAAPGEDIHSYGLEGTDAVGSGTSIATFLTSQVLAREIARDNTRTLEQIWTDFENTYLMENPSLNGKTSTGKQINFNWQPKDIPGCMDCEACNYFPYATEDDGSCYYCVEDKDRIIPLACPTGEYCPSCPTNAGCAAALVSNEIDLSAGEGIALMDLVTDNISGNWTGDNVIHFITVTGDIASYFQTYTAGVYKLYYTVKTENCEKTYFLIANVSNSNRIGINKTDQDELFTFYPNPTKDQVFISIKKSEFETSTFQLIDLTGKVLQQHTFEDSHILLKLGSLSKGMYMVQIQNEAEKSVQKLVIK